MNGIYNEISKNIFKNDSGGGISDWYENPIRATRDNLRTKEIADSESKSKFSKLQEVEIIKQFANENNLWVNNIDESRYLDEGAEQKVYDNGKTVLKVNDSIFYETWDDYFKALLLHNILFPYTKYELKGFQFIDNVLYSVVEQPYVLSNDKYDFEELKKFMENNGFNHKRNQDFYHLDLGIIIEDLHDENVLVNDGIYLVIDSAMYYTKS